MEKYCKNVSECVKKNAVLKESYLRDKKLLADKLSEIDRKLELCELIELSIFLIKVLFNFHQNKGVETADSILGHYINCIPILKKILDGNYNFTYEELQKSNQIIMGDVEL